MTYFLTVTSNGGSNCRIGSKVLDFVRRKYNNCLVDASDFGKAVNELKKYIDELNPLLKIGESPLKIVKSKSTYFKA